MTIRQRSERTLCGTDTERAMDEPPKLHLDADLRHGGRGGEAELTALHCGRVSVPASNVDAYRAHQAQAVGL